MASEKWSRKRDFGKKSDEQIVKVVMDDLVASRSYCQPYLDMFIRYYQMYRSYIRKEELRANGANLFIPRAFDCVETVTPRIVSALLGSRPAMGVFSLQDDEDMQTKASQMEKLMDYQAEQKMMLRYKLALLVKDSLIYGTSVGKLTWRLVQKDNTVRRQVKTHAATGVPISTEGVSAKTTVYDAPFIEQIDVFNIIVDGKYDNIDDMRFFGYTYSEDVDTILQKAESGAYDEKLVKKFLDDVGGAENAAGSSNDQPGSVQRLSSIDKYSNQQRSNGEVDLVDYWTDDWHVVVANGKYVILVEENPLDLKCKPFFSLHDCPVAGEFFSIGELEPIEYLQKELNTTRNQRIDNISMALNRMWMVIRGSGINPDELISRANGIINVPDFESLKELEMKDVSESGYREEPVIKDDIDRTLGVFDYTRGSQLERRETATTTTVMSEAANLRFKLKLDLLSMSTMKKLGRLWVSLNQQNIDHDINLAVLDEDGRRVYSTITPMDIVGEFDVIPAASATEPTVNKDSIINQFGQMVPNVINNPIINQPLFFKEFFRAMGFKSVDRMVYDDPSQNPLAAQQAPAEEMPQDGMPAEAMPQQMPAEAMPPEQAWMPSQDTLANAGGLTIEELAPLLQQLMQEPTLPPEIKSVFQQTLETGVITDECVQILEALANQISVPAPAGAQDGGAPLPM